MADQAANQRADQRAPLFGLDLVRATAVILVLASHGTDMIARWFHATSPRLIGYGAYYGIELFFVLSGFLIGGILIRLVERQQQGGRLRVWRIFMIRRWLRTLPAYYVCLATLVVLWAPILGLSGHRLAVTTALFAAMLQNLAWPMVQGNFFDVTWSLAVEEWFYLGFSALLLFASRFLSVTVALALTIGLFLAGPIAIRALIHWPAAHTDHVLIVWLDSIAIGVVVAVCAARFPRAFRAAAWLLPLSAVLLLVSLNGGLTRFGLALPWSKRVDPDFLAVLLALALPAAARWHVARGPAAAAVRAISRASYSLYLVHLSVLTMVDARRAAWHLSAAAAAAVSVAAIAILSAALSRWVERPIMAMRPAG